MAEPGPLFVYGPMAARSFLEAALGVAGADTASEALLPDHGLSAQPDAFPLPGLVDGGEGVQGRIVSDPEAVARLIYIGEALKLGPLQQVRPRREGHEVSARALAGWPGSLDWSAEHWSSASQATLDHATREIVVDMSSRPAADLAPTRAMILSRAAARVAAQDSVPTDLRSDARAEKVEEMRVETPHAGFSAPAATSCATRISMAARARFCAARCSLRRMQRLCCPMTRCAIACLWSNSSALAPTGAAIRIPGCWNLSRAVSMLVKQPKRPPAANVARRRGWICARWKRSRNITARPAIRP